VKIGNGGVDDSGNGDAGDGGSDNGGDSDKVKDHR
jgi:hypothetical protein